MYASRKIFLRKLIPGQRVTLFLFEISFPGIEYILELKNIVSKIMKMGVFGLKDVFNDKLAFNFNIILSELLIS